MADFWLHELTAKRVKALSPVELGIALRSLPLELPKVADNHLEADLERLQIDYCQMLIGPKNHISPVESVWIAEQFQSKSVDNMRTFFELLPGYSPPGKFYDHIGVQLDFAGHLLQAAARTPDDAGQVDDLVKVFVQQRLSWTGPFLQNVKHQSQTAFYRQLADATENWLSLFEA